MGEKVLKREIKKRKIEQRLVNFLDDDKKFMGKEIVILWPLLSLLQK